MNTNAISRGRSTGVVPFLFGVAGQPELPGRVLADLLVDVGLTASAARALIARMRVAGNLASTRQGRMVSYRLAGEMERRFHRVRAGAGRPTKAWRGSFHAVLYQVPEEQRAYRDLLRRTAVLNGYGILQQGVLISLTDVSDRIAAVLAQCPANAKVHRAQLAMAAEDAATAATLAWDLLALADTYREHIRTLRAAVRARRPGATARTLRRFVELSTIPLVDTLRDPGLPGELQPPRWPGPELAEVIGSVHAIYGAPARAYVHRRVAAFWTAESGEE